MSLKISAATCLLGLILFTSCKKEINQPAIISECLLVGVDTCKSLPYGNSVYYYNAEKKLTGWAFNELDIASRVFLDIKTQYDSVSYLPNGNVIVYSYQLPFTRYTLDTLPVFNRSMPYFKKTEFVHIQDKIAKIIYYDGSNKVLSYDTLTYTNAKLSQIERFGLVEVAGYGRFSACNNKSGSWLTSYSGKRVFKLTYQDENLHTVISSIESNNQNIGNDTLQFSNYSTLKNPYKKMTYLREYLFYSIRENVSDIQINYQYKLGSGTESLGNCSSAFLRYVPLDNGQNYPKDFGFYKCY